MWPNQQCQSTEGGRKKQDRLSAAIGRGEHWADYQRERTQRSVTTFVNCTVTWVSLLVVELFGCLRVPNQMVCVLSTFSLKWLLANGHPSLDPGDAVAEVPYHNLKLACWCKCVYRRYMNGLWTHTQQPRRIIRPHTAERQRALKRAIDMAK